MLHHRQSRQSHRVARPASVASQLAERVQLTPGGRMLCGAAKRAHRQVERIVGQPQMEQDARGTVQNVRVGGADDQSGAKTEQRLTLIAAQTPIVADVMEGVHGQPTRRRTIALLATQVTAQAALESIDVEQCCCVIRITTTHECVNCARICVIVAVVRWVVAGGDGSTEERVEWGRMRGMAALELRHRLTDGDELGGCGQVVVVELVVVIDSIFCRRSIDGGRTFLRSIRRPPFRTIPEAHPLDGRSQIVVAVARPQNAVAVVVLLICGRRRGDQLEDLIASQTLLIDTVATQQSASASLPRVGDYSSTTETPADAAWDWCWSVCRCRWSGIGCCGSCRLVDAHQTEQEYAAEADHRAGRAGSKRNLLVATDNNGKYDCLFLYYAVIFLMHSIWICHQLLQYWFYGLQ